MNIGKFGFALLVVGVGIAVGGSASVVLTRKERQMAKAYRRAKAEKRETTFEEKAAYSNYLAYCFGSTVCAFGLLLILIDIIIGS